MKRVIVRELAAPKSSKTARVKTVIGEDGQKIRMRSLDANSDEFAGDLLVAFKRNVHAARLKNRTLIGS